MLTPAQLLFWVHGCLYTMENIKDGCSHVDAKQWMEKSCNQASCWAFSPFLCADTDCEEGDFTVRPITLHVYWLVTVVYKMIFRFYSKWNWWLMPYTHQENVNWVHRAKEPTTIFQQTSLELKIDCTLFLRALILEVNFLFILRL